MSTMPRIKEEECDIDFILRKIVDHSKEHENVEKPFIFYCIIQVRHRCLKNVTNQRKSKQI